MLPLAASSPDANDLKSFLEVAFYLIGFVTAAVGLWKMVVGKGPKVEIAGQPFEFREAATFATKPELGELRSDLGDEIHQLHGRISTVRTEATDKIDAIEARIDAIPQRTIELLKTVKDYHAK